ncbi:hypothetical protein OHA25_50385 [Nonomuraea sp. NBC_00507]
MTKDSRLTRLATLCGNCGCPEVYLDPEATSDQEVVITDDFGRRI